MKQLGINHFVFYDDPQALQDAQGNVDDPRLIPVDLNTISLPKELGLDNLSERDNRMLLAEFLGHYTLDPQCCVVAAYPCSLLLHPGGVEATLPAQSRRVPMALDSILRAEFEPDLCYGVALADPSRSFPEYVSEIHQKFRVGSDKISTLGPHRGAVIVERDAYRRFQLWFREVTQYFLQQHPWTSARKSPGIRANLPGAGDMRSNLSAYSERLHKALESSIAYYFGQMFVGRLRTVDKCPRKTEPDPDLRAILELVAENNLVILAFCNNKYLAVLRNWVAAIRRHGIENVLVVAMDKDTQDICTELNVSCYTAKTEVGDLKDLWRLRVQIFRDVTKMGYDFIHSDIDAVWLKNPLPYLAALDGDLLVSQGTIQPPEIHDQWGFVLCAGFFLSRASRKMKIFYDLVIEDDRGDQISMNHTLASDGIEFDTPASYSRTFQNKVIACFKEPVTGKSDNFKLVLLPHHLFQRMVDDSSEAFVKHPLSRKVEADKLISLREHGCVFVE